MDTKILEYLDRFKEIREKKAALKRQHKVARRRAVNVSDLTARFLRVGPITLPIPTLLTEQLIKTYFGEWDTIDLSDPKHLAAVVTFYENGGNRDFGGMDKTALEEKVIETMTRVELSQHAEYYQEAITQINLALQKKNLLYQKTLIQETLETLGIDLAPNGQI